MTQIGRHHVEGFPTPEEEAAVMAALEKIIRDERERARPSAWRLAGRTGSLRLGLTEMRDRLGSRSWTLSQRIPWSGKPVDDLRGRGDAK